MGKMVKETLENDLSWDALPDEWFGLKRVFPVASGGIYPSKFHGNLDGHGIDCIIQAEEGVHGLPDGTTSGARAWCRQLKPGKNQSLFRIVQKTTKS